MNIHRVFSTFTATMVLTVSVSLCSAEQVENPLYRSWASFKTGSSRTLGGTVSMAGGFNVESEIASTLKDVSKDRVLIEDTTSITMNGQRRPGGTHTQNIASQIDKPQDWHEVGQEEVKAMGRTFKCTVYDGKASAPSRGGQEHQAEAKIWASKEVPGGIVQMKVTGANGADVTYVLKDYQAK